jgi:hypothetical protein
MSFRFLFGGRLHTARAMCVCCCMIIVEVIYYITIYNIDMCYIMYIIYYTYSSALSLAEK